MSTLALNFYYGKLKCPTYKKSLKIVSSFCTYDKSINNVHFDSILATVLLRILLNSVSQSLICAVSFYPRYQPTN